MRPKAGHRHGCLLSDWRAFQPYVVRADVSPRPRERPELRWFLDRMGQQSRRAHRKKLVNLFRRVLLSPAARGLAVFVFALWGWNGAAKWSAAFAASNSRWPLYPEC